MDRNKSGKANTPKPKNSEKQEVQGGRGFSRGTYIDVRDPMKNVSPTPKFDAYMNF